MFLFKGLIVCYGLFLASCNPVSFRTCPFIGRTDPMDIAKDAQAALADFAVNLLKTVSTQDDNKNQVASPVSITLALSMLENGADGKTRQELDRLLLESDYADVLKVYQNLQDVLQLDSEKVKLSIANGLFKQQDLKLKDTYLQTTEQCLGAEVQDADFQNQLEQTRQKINKFVADKTENKIPELFKQGVLHEDDKMVLANALYLNASWKTSFNKAQTKPDVFYKNGQDKQTVQYMHVTSDYRHASLKDLDVLELAYSNPDLAMHVILPKQRDGLKDLETHLNGKELRDIISRVEQKRVQVQLPKFTIRSQIDLKDALTKLGLESIFGNDADFNRMSETPLKVSAAVHEAYIKINENGTEAAAATGFSINIQAMPIAPVDPTPFVADHPFLYAIVHKPTGAIVFLGKINSIEQQDD